MRRLVSSRNALEADRAAELEFAYPSWLLMEEAGIRLQDRVERLQAEDAVPAGETVYLAGSGNNGGDALVMARQAYLRGHRSVSVIRIFPPASDLCRRQDELIRALGLPAWDWGSPEALRRLEAAALWVDGVWGTGLTGTPRGDRAQVLVALESLRGKTQAASVALDVPSGLWEGYAAGDPVLRARWTLAPGWLKDFCFSPAAREAVGVPIEVPLAFPRAAQPTAELVEADDLEHLVPAVAATDHKGRRGHVALVGAAPGMVGALVLAARSAAASGAGLVSLGVDEALISLVAPQVPAFQVRPASTVADLASRYDALVVGPGWGRTPDRPTLLRTLWASGLPLVLDADALFAWSSGWPERASPVVVTPHPGEFARLGVGPGEPETAAALARDRRVTVILKGAVTWILAPDGRRAVWDGANPALGTGGSGDCLAGVVGALLARGLGGFEAARAAVALHGMAGGDLAASEGWFTADRLPEALGRRAASCMAGLGPL